MPSDLHPLPGGVLENQARPSFVFVGGKYVGDIRIAGFPKDQSSFARISGYVEQFDIHAPYTTVGEALWISSRLRFDKSVTDETVKLFINEVFFSLGPTSHL